MPGPPILLFDGVCNLCDASVQFVMRHDPGERFRFASLQSEAARPYLDRAGLDASYLGSLVLVDEQGNIRLGSDAALGVGRRLRAPWRQLAAVGMAVPKPLREAVYRFVARHRYRVFGQKDECRIPTPAERARFLDAEELIGA
ncbi:MAG: thiol-disulfide oxidoreductase DCC family protein [Bacteroidota bacterium]